MSIRTSAWPLPVRPSATRALALFDLDGPGGVLAPYFVWDDGVQEWHDADGQLHRVDGPAVIRADGKREWRRHGKLHREVHPAVILPGRSWEWYADGLLHSKSGPAYLDINGTYAWFRRGLLHRDGGPAVRHPDGRLEWWVGGSCVRVDDTFRMAVRFGFPLSRIPIRTRPPATLPVTRCGR